MAGAPIESITSWFDERGWNWAYRTVDSQHFGVRQRRRRVFVVASQTEDPRTVLFADETEQIGEISASRGLRLLLDRGQPRPRLGARRDSHARRAGPGEVSPPRRRCGASVRRRAARSPGRASRWGRGCRVSVPDGRRTSPRKASDGSSSATPSPCRWRPGSGPGSSDPGAPVDVAGRPLKVGARWPTAASSVRGARESWRLSERPLAVRQRLTLEGMLASYGASPLSLGATRGFAERFKASRLKQPPGFVAALDAHVRVMS